MTAAAVHVMKSTTLGNHTLAEGHPPFIIAELSGNHNRSLERALELIDAAAEAGAHAVKLQTYTPDTMTIDCTRPEFLIDNTKSLWNGRGLYELYGEASTPWEWHEALFARASERGILCLSSPFDASAVDFLETLNCPIYKIASFENADLPLLRKVAATGKPVIISTGMATLADLDESVRELREHGCASPVLLKCTSTYPATPENSHLRTIAHMRTLFDCPVGLSDHTLGIGVSVASVAFGACVIEKHFTLRRADGGVDSAFSLEPEELRMLVEETARAALSLGGVAYGCTEAERDSLQFRRSLYVTEDMSAGDVFTEKNLRVIRPGFGLPPKYFEHFLGKRITCDAPRGTAVNWAMLG